MMVIENGGILEIRITTLSENTANYGFIGEWGLSILVEVDGTRILVDIGLNFSAVHFPSDCAMR